VTGCAHARLTQAAYNALHRANRIRSAGAPFRPEDVEDVRRLIAEAEAGTSPCTGEHVTERHGVQHRSADGETWWDPEPDPETYGYDYDAEGVALPTLANAIARVEAYVSGWGDGEPDRGLHTRDLAVLLDAAKRSL
jgi:hypothetical protein